MQLYINIMFLGLLLWAPELHYSYWQMQPSTNLDDDKKKNNLSNSSHSLFQMEVIIFHLLNYEWLSIDNSVNNKANEYSVEN